MCAIINFCVSLLGYFTPFKWDHSSNGDSFISESEVNEKMARRDDHERRLKNGLRHAHVERKRCTKKINHIKRELEKYVSKKTSNDSLHPESQEESSFLYAIFAIVILLLTLLGSFCLLPIRIVRLRSEEGSSRISGISHIFSDDSSSGIEIRQDPVMISESDEDTDLLNKAHRAMLIRKSVDVINTIELQEEDMVNKITAIMARVCSYAYFMCQCTTRKDMINVTGVTLSQYFSAHHIAFMKSLFASQEEGLVPEAITKVSFAKFMRNGIYRLQDTCYPKIFVDTLAALVFASYTGSGSGLDMEAFLKNMSKNIGKKLEELSFVDCVVSVVEYVAGLKNHISSGLPILDFIMPESVFSRISSMMKDRDSFMNGFEISGTLSTVLSEAEQLEYELKQRLRSNTGNAYLRLQLQSASLKLADFINRIRSDMKNGRIRHKPYGIIACGESHIGKTYITQVLLSIVQNVKKKVYSDEQIAYIQPFSKYDDTVSLKTEFIIIDDLGAIRPDKVEVSDTPAARLIDMVNNQPACSRQASLDSKGTVYYRPDAVVSTTNLVSGGIEHAASHLQAISNRFQYVYVRVKEKFADARGDLDPAKVRTYEVDDLQLPEPYHEFRFYRIACKGSGYSAEYETDYWLDTPEFMQELHRKVSNHFDGQTGFVKSVNDVRKFDICPNCHTFKAPGYCQCPEAEEKLQSESLELITAYLSRRTMDLCASLSVSWIGTVTPVSLDYACDVSAFMSLQAIRYGTKLQYYMLTTFPFIYFCCVWPFVFAFVYVIRNIGVWLALFWVVAVFVYFCLVSKGLRRVFLKKMTREWTNSFRVGVLSSTLTTGAFLAVGFFAVKRMVSLVFANNPVVAESGGVISPTTEEEVIAKTKEYSDWAKRPSIVKPAYPMNVKSMTQDQSKNVIERCIWRFDTGAVKGNCFFVNNQEVLVPRHAWIKAQRYADLEKTAIAFRKSADPGEGFSSFVRTWVTVLDDNGVEIDAVLLRLTHSPSMPVVRKFFTDEEAAPCCCSMYTRDKNYGLETRTLLWAPTIIPANEEFNKIRGSAHFISEDTSSGDCMSPIVREGNPNAILGFHCGKTSHKYFAFLMKSQWLEDAHRKMNVISSESEFDLPDVLPWNSDPRTALYGTDMDFSDPVDERHPICFKDNLEQEGLTFLGYNKTSRVTARGIMHETPATPFYREAGKLQHGKPVLRSNRDHGAALQKNRHGLIPPELLRKATLDYIKPIRRLVRLFSVRRPLTLMEALNGIPGNRYIHQIDENTAAGYGVKGKKAVLLDITYSDTDGRKILTPKPEFMDDCEEIERNARNGISSNHIVRTAVKVESVKVDPDTLLPVKDKNRIFAVHPMASFITLRRYAMPILEFMSVFNQDMETAVGMNVTNYDWNALALWLLEYGPEHAIATDYSGFDTSISSQVMMEVTSIFMYIARAIGYSAEDTATLGFLIHDVARCTMLFNGALLDVNGWNPSGTVVTVAMNGIPNSLYVRCAFYEHAQKMNNSFLKMFSRDDTSDFRENVRCMTLGDDLVATVKGGRFNQYDFKDFCDEIGLKLTADDKGPITTKFCNLLDVAFLKRKFRYEERVEAYVAPLELTSIYKSMCLLNESDTDTKTIMVQNMDNALREFARHDFSVFERESAFLYGVASQLGVVHLIPHIHWSYDDWWKEFKHKYYVEGDIDLDIESPN